MCAPQVPKLNVVGSMRDSCATNGAGLRVVKPLLPAMVDLMCCSHMLHCAGQRLAFTVLDDIIIPLITLQHMAVVRSLWLLIVGSPIPRVSKLRWWSRWELMKALASAFRPLLDQFIAQLIARDIGDCTTTKIQSDSSSRSREEKRAGTRARCSYGYGALRDNDILIGGGWLVCAASLQEDRHSP